MTKSTEFSLPQYLREAREKAGLTQKQVADRLGYTTAQFISAWERGDREPPMNVVYKLAGLLKLDAEELFEMMVGYRMTVIAAEMRADFEASRKTKRKGS